MKEQDKVTNKLIQDFMESVCNCKYDSASIPFTYDWGLLIQVVEEIEHMQSVCGKMYTVDINENKCSIMDNGFRCSRSERYSHMHIADTKKEALIMALVAFIKYYNTLPTHE